MKKILIAFAVFAIAGSPVFAQTSAPVQSSTTAAPTDDRAVSMAKEMQQELTLTDDQYNKIVAVNTECLKRKDALKASGQTDRSAYKPIMDYRDQQYATILTADQETKYQAIEAQKKAAREAAHNSQ
jgi:Spy/CpxP family protein refolding chaperone